MGSDFRSIVWDPRAERHFTELEGDVGRLDEVRRAIEFAISHRPENGQVTSHPVVWAWPTTGEEWGAGALVCYYRIDEHDVVVLDVRKVSDLNKVPNADGL